MEFGHYKVVKSEVSHHSFSPSLVLSGSGTLPAGLYMVMVDVRWNKIALENSCLRKLNITVSSTNKISIVQQTMTQGLDILKKVFHDHSQHEKTGTITTFPGEMNYAFYYFEDSPYKNSWFAYLITQNGYPKQLLKEN